MNLENFILISLVFFGVAGFSVSLICLAINHRNKKLIDSLTNKLEDFAAEFIENMDQTVDSNDRSIDHGRRIAWLETRVRKPEKFKSEGSVAEMHLNKRTSGTNMTERRHRVLTLAKRGQDASSIATALGMLIGEVELIMNLGRGSGQYV